MNTLDSGPGSLRDAIVQANDDSAHDTIQFAIPGAGPHVIAPASVLPTITNPVTIDGYTQSGASPNTDQYTSNAVIMIELDGSNAGNSNGLNLLADDCTIRGLAIHSFDGPQGIRLDGQGNVVEGNFIGTDSSGTAAGLGNGENGVTIPSPSAQFNRVGTNADGANDLGERNVIVGHPSGGLRINGGSQFNTVAGNFLGVDATGATAIPNASGVLLFAGASDNTIGGDGVAGNVISGNNEGVTIGVSGQSSHNNIVQGNLIGTDASGQNALPNQQNGINIDSSSNNNQIVSNVISANGGQGVLVKSGFGNAIRGNSIHSNGGLGIDLFESIFQGVVTVNDDDDLDAGANALQNYPDIGVAESGSVTRVAGLFDGEPGVTVAIDFYASSAADPSGHGEGQRYLGSTNVMTDGNGVASYDVLLAASTATGEYLTTTATNLATGDTSEFSAAVIVVAPPVIQVEIDVKPGNDENPLNVGSNGTLAVAILTTSDFDAADVDATTVVFAGALADHYALEDVDDDGDLDLLLHFRVNETNLEQTYSDLLENDLDEDGILDSTNQLAEVTLTGETLDETLIEGTDQMDLFLRGRALRDLLDELFDS